MNRTEHSSKTYEGMLGDLRSRLISMASIVEQMVAQGGVALSTADAALAEKTRRNEKHVNELELEADELCIRLIALRQPVASDLRLITASFKLVNDFQRMGRSSAIACSRTIELCALPQLELMTSLRALNDDVAKVVHEAVGVITEEDETMARALLTRDANIDRQYHEICGAVASLMARDPETIFRANCIQMLAKDLERIADHAMNIARQVIFIVTGTDIRHT